MSFEREMTILRINSSHWEIGPKRKHALKRLIARWGNDVIPNFNLLITNPYYTLQNLADKYEVTRERIRQLVFVIYGFKYTHFTKELLKKKAEDRLYCIRHPLLRGDKKGGQYEAAAFKKLKEMGMQVKTSPTVHAGWWLFSAVCSSSTAHAWRVDVHRVRLYQAARHSQRVPGRSCSPSSAARMPSRIL